jgi:biopolymer transport protein ExbB/TolQ
MPSPDPNDLWQWLLALMAFLGAVKFILDLWRDHFRQNPPLHLAYASRKEQESLAAEVRDHKRHTEARFLEMASASSAARDKIYTSIRAMEQAVAGLTASNQHTASNLGRVEMKLDRLIEKARHE